MAKQGDKIINTRTGQIMVFLRTADETNGEILEIECFSPLSPMKEPEHYHPHQENIFQILSGSCVFSIDGKEKIVGPGETISIPPGVKHHFWNSDNTTAHYLQEFRPALNIDSFFETFFALSRDNKLNEKGIPNLFHGSLIMLKHKDDIRVSKPSWLLQLITYYSLAPIGWLLGYRNNYKSKS